MKPHEICKYWGLETLKEVSKITGKTVPTLINWATKAPRFFLIVVLGVGRYKELEKYKNL